MWSRKKWKELRFLEGYSNQANWLVFGLFEGVRNHLKSLKLSSFITFFYYFLGSLFWPDGTTSNVNWVTLTFTTAAAAEIQRRWRRDACPRRRRRSPSTFTTATSPSRSASSPPTGSRTASPQPSCRDLSFSRLSCELWWSWNTRCPKRSWDLVGLTLILVVPPYAYFC